MERQFKIAVLGSASVPSDPADAQKAFRIGQGIASRAGILLTGGCPGLPHFAVQGTADAGGYSVAISPAMNREEHDEIYGYPLDSRVIVYTGMGRKGRNVILIRSADACVFLGGGMGTLNEFTIAFDELGTDCAIGVLPDSPGLTGWFARLVSVVGRRPRALIREEADPDRLLDGIFEHLLQD